MTDDKPDLTTTEVRQGNSRKMNTRALVFGMVILVILFAAVYFFSTATYDDTDTTTGAGTTIEETDASVGEDEDTEALPGVEDEAETPQ